MNKHPSWIRQLDFLLPDALRESPFGHIPQLHLNQLEPILKKHLHAHELQVELDAIQTADLKAIYKDFAPEPFIQAIHLEPVHQPVFLLFRAADVDKAHHFLTQGKLPADAEVFKGVVKFLALKGVAAIDELHLFKGLSPHLASHSPTEGLYEVFDLTLNMSGLSLSPRVIVGEKTLDALKHFYLKNPASAREQNTEIPVPLHLELGSVGLTEVELKSLEKLDLVHLEHLSRDVLHQHYDVTLTYKNTPLLSATFKDHLIQGFSPVIPKPQETTMASIDDDFDHIDEIDEEDFASDVSEEDSEEEFEEEMDQDASATVSQAPIPKTIPLKKVALDCKIELGAVNIPYNTLSNLTAESTIAVDLDPKQVFLTLNGQILHRGELVEFDHQLFFKVLE